MNLFSLHCRGVNSINDEVKYAETESNASLLAIAEARQYMRAGCVGKMLTAGSHIGT